MLTANSSRQKRRAVVLIGGVSVPGRQTAPIRGVEFTVEPDSWIHRVLHWPFFFESTNYTFRVAMHRVAEEDPNDPWPNDEIVFAIRFENEDLTHRPIHMPSIKVGDTFHLSLDRVYVSHPGQTILLIDLNYFDRLPPAKDIPLRAEQLFSYRVRPEEAIWLAGAAAVVLLITAVVSPFCFRDDVRVGTVIDADSIEISLASPTPVNVDTIEEQ